MLTIPPLEKIISRSRSSKMRNTNAITNSSSSVTSIETRADRNGGGIVYHRSNCGYPRHRFYGNGGDWDGSACGNWVPLIPYVYKDISFTEADVIWYGEYNNESRVSLLKQSYESLKNKTGGGKHNWTEIEITNVTCTAVGFCVDEPY